MSTLVYYLKCFMHVHSLSDLNDSLFKLICVIFLQNLSAPYKFGADISIIFSLMSYFHIHNNEEDAMSLSYCRPINHQIEVFKWNCVTLR